MTTLLISTTFIDTFIEKVRTDLQSLEF